MSECKAKKVAIVGGGFGGVAAARQLKNQKNIQVHLIDKKNHHLFQPLLYQVAMAGLNPSEIAVPLRKLFGRSSNIFVELSEVQKVDLSKTALYFDHEWHKYDYIILATGSTHSYFGKTSWEEHAPGLKNIEQATEIRRRVLLSFENAEKIESESEQLPHLTFAIVGGGPTGVELAVGIAEMAKSTLKNDYKNAALKKTKVYLIESGPRILSGFHENLSQKAQKDLEKLGVEVITNQMADDLSADGLKVGEKEIKCKTIIWAAGVEPVSLIKNLKASKNDRNQIIVGDDLSLNESNNIFAIGDIAYKEDSEGKPLPGVAPVALQQGDFVGKLIRNEVKKAKKREKFKYFDKGLMATIGRSKAVLESGSIRLTGLIAWLAWVFVHIVYLLRFRNKIFVLLQWSWSYFKFGNGARLIVSKNWKNSSNNEDK